MLQAFDRGIKVLEDLVAKVQYLPAIGGKARACLEDVRKIRMAANDYLGKALRPVQDVLDTVVMRLERESLEQQRGILNVNNIHYRGALPEASAVTLMRRADPLPEWLSKGTNSEYPPLDFKELRKHIARKAKENWPELQQHNVESFADIIADELKGPARLFRVLAPNSRAMSDCWVTEAVFKRLQESADPRAAWRKHLAVWPDWNVNGQFVVYDVKVGETLKIWRGKAASQFKDNLPNLHLEGGWEQVVFTVARSDTRNDTMRYYTLNGGRTNRLQNAINQQSYAKLSKEEKDRYVGLREAINHPNISGPFDTGWGYSDFGGTGLGERIGLPSLPGQTTQLIK